MTAAEAQDPLVRRLYGLIVEHHVLLERTLMPDGSMHVAACPICSDPIVLKTVEELAEALNKPTCNHIIGFKEWLFGHFKNPDYKVELVTEQSRDEAEYEVQALERELKIAAFQFCPLCGEKNSPGLLVKHTGGVDEINHL